MNVFMWVLRGHHDLLRKSTKISLGKLLGNLLDSANITVFLMLMYHSGTQTINFVGCPAICNFKSGNLMDAKYLLSKLMTDFGCAHYKAQE